MQRRREPRARNAFLGSVALHALVVAAVGVAGVSAGPAPKRTVVYRVDIVSPPPNVAGEPLAEPPAPAEPGPAAAATPAPAPEPEPTPPAPEPEPQPEAPKQPAPPRETPKRPPPREEPRPRAEPPRETPKRNEPRTERPATRPGTAERPGTGSGTDRSAGTGTRPGPATGRNPDASSPGGEGLNVRTRGVACPENYCNNVVRQVRRFFRAPDGTQGASGNVCFTLFRDGSVEDVSVERQRGGGFQFRLALVEAVEQAGVQHAFGPLPRGFEVESLQLCVLVSPATT